MRTGNIVAVMMGVRDKFLAMPGVVGIAVGHRQSTGTKEGEATILILVRQSKRSFSDQIPAAIDGFPTEIIDVGFEEADESVVSQPPVSASAPGLRNIQGGVGLTQSLYCLDGYKNLVKSDVPRSIEDGTLTLVIHTRVDGLLQRVLLSCDHFFFGSGVKRESLIDLICSPVGGKIAEKDNVGILQDHHFGGYTSKDVSPMHTPVAIGIDGATATMYRLDPDTQFLTGVAGTTLIGVGGVSVGTRITAYTRNGPKTGKVRSVTYSMSIAIRGEPRQKFDYQILCEMDVPILEGESGSPVVNSDQQIIGMLWSRSITADRFVSVSPIQPILERFKLEFSTESVSAINWTRWVRDENGSHLYTTPKEGSPLGSGWRSEGVMCRVLERQESGTVPVYRYYNGATGDHCYKTRWFDLRNDCTEKGGATGYELEGVPCYVFSQPAKGRVPIYMFVRSGSGIPLHYYQLEMSAPPGWQYDDGGNGTNPDKAIMGYGIKIQSPA